MFEVLAAPKWPARMFSEQVAEELGCEEADIPILMAAGLLIPLGDPSRNSIKRFARDVILELGHDVDWLHRATLAIARYWLVKKNRQ